MISDPPEHPISVEAVRAPLPRAAGTPATTRPQILERGGTEKGNRCFMPFSPPQRIGEGIEGWGKAR
jgi:hypothetical protein